MGREERKAKRVRGTARQARNSQNMEERKKKKLSLGTAAFGNISEGRRG